MVFLENSFVLVLSISLLHFAWVNTNVCNITLPADDTVTSAAASKLYNMLHSQQLLVHDKMFLKGKSLSI